METDRQRFLDSIGKDMIWTTTQKGRARGQKGLSQFISAAVKKAGLATDRTAHGLRKALAIALVHAGWTPIKLQPEQARTVLGRSKITPVAGTNERWSRIESGNPK